MELLRDLERRRVPASLTRAENEMECVRVRGGMVRWGAGFVLALLALVFGGAFQLPSSAVGPTQRVNPTHGQAGATFNSHVVWSVACAVGTIPPPNANAIVERVCAWTTDCDQRPPSHGRLE